MSDCGEGELRVSTADAYAEVEQLRQHTEMTSQQLLGLIRKTYSTLAYLGDIFNFVIPQFWNLLISSIQMAAQAWRTASIATAAAGGPVFSYQAVMQFMAASMMFVQAAIMLNEKNVIDQKLNSIIGLLNLWS